MTIVLTILMLVLGIPIVNYLSKCYTLMKAKTLIKCLEECNHQISGALLEELTRLEPRLCRMADWRPGATSLQASADRHLLELGKWRLHLATQVLDFSKCPPLQI